MPKYLTDSTHKANNLGWCGCIYIREADLTVLAVKAIERPAQIHAQIQKESGHGRESERAVANRVREELARGGILKKPVGWGLPGGKIAWWKNNKEHQEEFMSRCVNKTTGEVDHMKANAFLDEIAQRIGDNKDLLHLVADGSAHYEFVEETDLVIADYEFLMKRKDRDMQNRGGTYPRYYFIVKSVSMGERWEPKGIKNVISAPHWIPLMQLRKYRPGRERFVDRPYFLYPSHAAGIIASARRYLNEGDERFKPVLEHLLKEFGESPPDAVDHKVVVAPAATPLSDEEEWEHATSGITPLKK